MDYEPKFCGHCGEPIADWNENGYCSRTAECRRKGQYVYQGKPPDTEVPVCLNCGKFTQSKYGFCKRNPECLKLREQVRNETTYQKKLPESTCAVCGGLTRSILGVCGSSAACRAAKYTIRKRECLEAYGGACCTCCGETRLYFLTLDHVNGDGAEDRKQFFSKGSRADSRPRGNQYQALKSRGYPDKDRYQVLCWNCNCAKKNAAVCPCAAEQLFPGAMAALARRATGLGWV
jgi:hypothetical protein